MRRDRSVLEQKITPGTVRRIAHFARPYRKLLGLFGVVVVLDAAVAAVNPLFFRAIIDDGIDHHRTKLIVILALVVAGLALFDSLFTLAERIVVAKVGEGLVCDMRTRVFNQVQAMPLAFFTRTRTGSLVSRLNADVLGAQSAFTDLMSNVMGNLVLVSFVLAVMFVLSWQITLVALVVLPVVALPVRAIGRRLAALTRQRYDHTAAMVTMMTERFSVGGALLVKLFGDPDDEAATFAGWTGKIRDVGVELSLVGRVLRHTHLVGRLVDRTRVWVGRDPSVRRDARARHGRRSAADLGRLYVPMSSSLAGANVDAMTTLVAFERVFEVLDLEPILTELPDAVVLARGRRRWNSNTSASPIRPRKECRWPRSSPSPHSTGEPGCRCCSMSASPSPRVSSSLSLGGRERARQRSACSSPGSTTSTRVLCVSAATTYRATSLASLRAKIGVVTQDPHLFHDTLRANLLYSRPGASDEELFDSLAQAQVADVVAGLPDGINTVVGERGYRLSGGEKQRVALARLILKAPDVIVLDEATAHLDSESEEAVQRALRSALAGRTSLVIAHRLSTVRRADCILVVDAGRIVERGTHRELLEAGGLYADLYRTQFDDHLTAGSNVRW